MTHWGDEFKKFILRGNAVELAVGIVIGAAFGAVVDAIVKGLFLPVFGLITGGINFASWELTLYKDAKLAIGLVIQSVISFVIIGFCLFLVVKAMNRIVRKDAVAPTEPSTSERLLMEIRDMLRDLTH